MQKKCISFFVMLFCLCKFCDGQTVDFDFYYENQKVSQGCAGSTVILKNLSSDTTHSFQWEINGFKIYTSSTFFIFSKEGTYPIILTDNSTGISITKNILINKLPTADFDLSQSSICVGSSMNFTANTTTTSTISNYYWNFDDEALTTKTNPINYIFNKSGSKKIYLYVKDANGCYSATSESKTLTVNGASNASFNSDNLQYYSCSNSISLNLNSDNTNQQFNWDFGDGQSSTGTQTTITHTFAKPGKYLITLSTNSTDNSTCNTKYTHNIYVGKPSLKIYSPDSVCTNTSFNLNASDSLGNFNFSSSELIWSTDNGIFSTDSTSLSYSVAGNYNLNVYNNIGCRSDASSNIKVNQTPTLNVSVTPSGTICSLIPISFIANTDIGTNIKWQISDGTSEILSKNDTLTHTFKNSGSYNITATTSSSESCSITSQSYTATLTNDCVDKGIDSILNQVFKFYSLCDDKYLVTFVNLVPSKPFQSISIDGVVYPFTTDSTTIRLPFKSKGATYTVLVRFKDGTYDRVRDITIIDETAQFSVKNNDNATLNCAQNYYTISTSGFVNSANISNFIWKIEDINTGNTIYSNAGANLSSFDFNLPDVSTYRITLTMYDIRTNPCITTFSSLITTQGPVGNFKASGDSVLCNPKGTVVIQNLSEINNSSFASMVWDFGDGQKRTITSLNTDTIQHYYSYTGSDSYVTYSINLRITDNAGCTSNLTKTGQFKLYNPKLNISTSIPIYCQTKTVQIYNNSNIADLLNDNYQWQINNQEFNTANTQALNFTKPDEIYPENFNVKISAQYGPNGKCNIDTTFKDLIKFIKPIAQFHIIDSNLIATCPPYTLHIKNESSGYDNLKWTFSDSIYNTSLNDTITYYVERPDYYSIQLQTNGYDNCIDTSSFSFMSLGPKATLSNTIYKACTPLTTLLKVNSVDSIQNYLWAFGDTTTLTSDSIFQTEHTYNNPGSYDPRVVIIGTEATGHCFNNLSLSNSIVVDPKINLKYLNNYTYCMGDSSTSPLKLQVYTSIGKEFYWSTSPDDIETIKSDRSSSTIYVTPSHPTDYFLYAKSENTCADESATVHVETHESPVVSFPKNEMTVAAGEQFYTNPTIISNIGSLTYNWSPTTQVSNALVENPSIIGDNNITYTLSAKNSYGCAASDSIDVNVLCSTSKSFIPSAFTPNNDGRNDKFYVRGYGIKSIRHFYIADRWGKILFEKNNVQSNDYSQGWDGRSSGDLAPAGTYVYYAQLECTEGNIYTLKGTVVLIR
ncbi:PKD domain-containing protein [Rhizosphaericola mali]|uniref:PKD domain-containing protein n=1 Tax=Rhizosphaericola mali TaxID=2545455 RepID=A0A5P2G376_9BACT|nr:PKD domain-containing protein [Rhizosphaericola mali]QES88260.1 PKD domain-containing protein [Rhizosphaericola mali]